MSEEKEFATHDLLLVTYLHYKKIPFSRLPEKTSKRQVTFFYNKSPQVEEACRSFIGSEAQTVLLCHRDMKILVMDLVREVK
jgi:hypothetical protein